MLSLRMSLSGAPEPRNSALRSLNLFEQADVLDRDDRLVGKCFEQGDLLIRKRPNFRAANMNHANGTPFAHERSCQRCSNTDEPR